MDGGRTGAIQNLHGPVLERPTSAICCCVGVIERLQQAHEVRRRRQKYQDMKNLVRTTPDVEMSWLQPLRHACLENLVSSVVHRKAIFGEQVTNSVDTGTKNIQKTLQKHPSESDLTIHLLYSEQAQSMEDWENSR